MKGRELRGIEGIRGAEPIGAVLRVGKRGPRGFPVDRDRFTIAEPTVDGSGSRPLHPSFGPFNKRQISKVQGVLVHGTEQEAFHYQRKAQVIRKPAHPDMRPQCVGNGKVARRWFGPDPQEFRDIACPGRACEYSSGSPPPCKPDFVFLFRPVWPDGNPLPTPLMKLASRSIYSTENFVGFFGHVRDQAAHLGLGPSDFTLFGLQFMIGLSEKSKASRGRKFPVLTITPTVDIQEFLYTQAARRLTMSESPRVLALTDDGAHAPAERYQDFVELGTSRPRRPDGG